jgi:hypothetical protein
MSPNVLLEIAELQDKTVSQLVLRYGMRPATRFPSRL